MVPNWAAGSLLLRWRTPAIGYRRSWRRSQARVRSGEVFCCAVWTVRRNVRFRSYDIGVERCWVVAAGQARGFLRLRGGHLLAGGPAET
jgi:hypothetical protein